MAKSSPNAKQDSSARPEYDYGHELVNEDGGGPKHHHFCYHYYTLWQSELYKAQALEKQNERLENKLKLSESKLDREIVQQIKISLEWRKMVVVLVDENTRLKQQLADKQQTISKLDQSWEESLGNSSTWQGV